MQRAPLIELLVRHGRPRRYGFVNYDAKKSAVSLWHGMDRLAMLKYGIVISGFSK